MKKEYNLDALKKRSGKIKVDFSSVKIPVSVRLNGDILAWFKTESLRQGIPYQTLIGSVLHRYAIGELIDLKEFNFAKKINNG